MIQFAGFTGVVLCYQKLKRQHKCKPIECIQKKQIGNVNNIWSNVITSWLDSWVEGGCFPGATLTVFDGNGNEFGYFESNTTINNQVHDNPVRSVHKETLFRIYSMTKPITTVAAMILIERNMLSLHDDVQQWIPAFANACVLIGGTVDSPIVVPTKQRLKVFHLMTHTSGITYGMFGNSLNDQILNKNLGLEPNQSWSKHLSLSELCNKIAQTPLCFEPGTKFHYGLSSDVLGYIIELASGTTLDNFFQTEIFDKLSMNETSFFVKSEDIHRLADCYEVQSNQSLQISKYEERDRTYPTTYPYTRCLSGGGGLVSTISDYKKFVMCLMNDAEYYDQGVRRRLLSHASIEMMISNQLPNNSSIKAIAFDHGTFSEALGDGNGFGLGLSILINPLKSRGDLLSGLGQFGWGGVASTYFFVDPVNKFGAIFMTQLIPSSIFPIRPQLKWLTHNLVKSFE